MLNGYGVGIVNSSMPRRKLYVCMGMGMGPLLQSIDMLTMHHL